MEIYTSLTENLTTLAGKVENQHLTILSSNIYTNRADKPNAVKKATQSRPPGGHGFLEFAIRLFSVRNLDYYDADFVIDHGVDDAVGSLADTIAVFT